jgi:hypothetical protein
MIELHLIVSIFLLVILSFCDFIVYNEEVLLTVCFLAFLFYCFNTLSESVYSSFESRAAKIEQDLLLTFSSTKASLVSEFQTNLKLVSFFSQINCLLFGLLNFLSVCLTFVDFKHTVVYYQACTAMFNELVLFSANLVQFLRESLVVQLLYSLVLNKTTNDLTFLAISGITNNKFSELKHLSV